MALIRWEPAAELNTIQTEMNRLFNSLFDTPARAATGDVTRRWIPAMDLVETGDHYVLRADLPGPLREGLNIELESKRAHDLGRAQGERTDEKGGYRRVERAYGSFSRSLTLPDGVDPEAVEASFDRGVLEVKIPKPEQIKPRKVTISVGSGGDSPEAIVEGTAKLDARDDRAGGRPGRRRVGEAGSPAPEIPPIAGGATRGSRGPRPTCRGPLVALTDVTQLPARALARARARASAYKLRVRPGTDSFRAYHRWTLCLSACFWWLELGERACGLTATPRFAGSRTQPANFLTTQKEFPCAS